MRVGKGFGLIAFTALLLVLLIFSISITQQYVSDIDASTYVIVPMLMLPIFAVFMFKHSDRIVPKVDAKSIVLGTVLFAVFIIMILDLRAYLGPLFFSYRMDMLLLPIAIAALATLIFGSDNLDRFVWIAIYALAASPLLLLPVINMNLNFASANSLAIYYSAKVFFNGVTFISPITVAYNGHQISIGNSCIGIGALIALVLLLLPIAYFLDGSNRKKLLWVLSGFLLLVLLNFIRMLAITFAWFKYGPNQSILDVHAVVGQIIFYAVVLVMIFVAGKYGLSYPKIGLGRRRRSYNAAAISIAVIFSVLYLFISASYSGSTPISITSISQNASLNWKSAGVLYSTYLTYPGVAYSTLGAGNRSAAIVLVNSSGNRNRIIAVFGQNGTGFLNNLNYSYALAGWKEYINRGSIAYLYQFNTNPKTLVYYSSIVYPQGQDNYLFGMYIVKTGYSGNNSSCLSAYDVFYDDVANIAELNPNAFNLAMDNGYCSISGVVR